MTEKDSHERFIEELDKAIEELREARFSLYEMGSHNHIHQGAVEHLWVMPDRNFVENMRMLARKSAIIVMRRKLKHLKRMVHGDQQ